MVRKIGWFIMCLVVGGGALSQDMRLLPVDKFSKVRDGLPSLSRMLSSTDTIHVAYLGGSITFNPGWRDKVDSFFREQFPKSVFRFVAAGIPSLGSVPHAFRLQRDLLDSGRVDLLFVESAVNDRTNGTDSADQVAALEGIVRHVRKQNPACDILMMAFADPDKNADYDNGRVPVEVANQERVANYYHLPSANLAKEVHDRIAHHEFDWEHDFKDVHPSPFGQQLYFQSIKSLLEKCLALGSRLRDSVVRDTTLPRAMASNTFDDGRYVSVAQAIVDSSWRLYPRWRPDDSLATRPGYVGVPVIESTSPGGKAQLEFTGDAVGIAVVSGPDAGVVRYSIDHGQPKMVDLYTQWSSSLHLPWYLVLASGLPLQKHVLSIRVDKTRNVRSKGNACRIVYFLVDGR